MGEFDCLLGALSSLYYEIPSERLSNSNISTGKLKERKMKSECLEEFGRAKQVRNNVL